MGLKLNPGDPLPFEVNLECFEGDTFFVDVIVLDPDRDQILGSPIDLTDEGGGNFFDDSQTYPDLDFISITGRVFEDAAKTIPADDFCEKTVHVHRSLEKSTDSKISQLLAQGVDLGLTGNVEAESEITGILDGDDLEISGNIETDGMATGEVEEIDAQGNINDEENLIGSI